LRYAALSDLLEESPHMRIRCPNCGHDLDAKEIVALESWHDDDNGEVVRTVVLQCPGCSRALTPSTASDAGLAGTRPA
jgi:hypothetical protein